MCIRDSLIGDLKGKDVLIIDDMIDTAGTTVNAADAAISNGANSVTAVATHAVLSGPAIERIKGSVIKKLIVTDTVSIADDKKMDNTWNFSLRFKWMFKYEA